MHCREKDNDALTERDWDRQRKTERETFCFQTERTWAKAHTICKLYTLLRFLWSVIKCLSDIEQWAQSYNHSTLTHSLLFRQENIRIWLRTCLLCCWFSAIAFPYVNNVNSSGNPTWVRVRVRVIWIPEAQKRLIHPFRTTSRYYEEEKTKNWHSSFHKHPLCFVAVLVLGFLPFHTQV